MFKSAIRIISITTALFIFVGCNNENPVEADQQTSFAQQEESTSGPIQLLKVDPVKAPKFTLQKGNNEDTWVEEKINKKKSAKLEIDNDLNGKSKIEFEKYTFDKNIKVHFSWAADFEYTGEISVVKEKDEDAVFSKPAKLELRFEQAHLGKVNLENLVFAIYNADSKEWEIIPAEIEADKFKLKAEISRFGTFSLFENEDGNFNSIFKTGPHQYYTKKFIKADKGGKLKVGGKESGESELEFPKNALPEDLTILFDWTASGTFEGTLNNMEFGPHGTYFNEPVMVELSYKMADLTGVVEENLQVYYYHEDSDTWELIGGTVDTDKKIITVYLEHFSRYAIAYGR